MIRFASNSVPAPSQFRRRVRMLLLGAALFGASPAMAAPPQATDDEEGPASVSRPVVEPTAPSAGKALNAALGHLARDPRNVDALLEAGNAALALGDNEAALGFFTRADQVSPANATVKVAIAGARLHLDDPVEALRWYAEAEKTGADPSAFALDRGLAFDLVGDNTASIAQYRLVLARSRDPVMRDEATRREALSLAIGGDRRGADLALLPLLQRQDRAAWRAHIFVLAIAGRGDDAVGVAHATMPPDLAESISPYLRFMVRLTPAQQAAVASLGRFPRAADIGRDDPRVMAYSATHPRVPLILPPQVLARAAPTATELKAARKRHGQAASVAGASTPAPLPDIALPAPPPPVMLAANTGPVPAPSAGHAPVVVARTPPGALVASRSTSSRPSGFDLAQTTGSARPTAPATPAISPTVPQPVVLSKLDMPPPPRRTTAAPVTTPAAPAFAVAAPVAAARVTAPGPVMVSSAVVQPTPQPVVSPPPALAVASPLPAPATLPTVTPPVAVASSPARFEPAIPEPAATASGTPATIIGAVAAPPVPTPVEPPVSAQHAVVEPIPAPAPVPVVAPLPPRAKPVPDKAPKDKAGGAQLAKDESASAKSGPKAEKDSKGRTKAGKDKAAPTDDALDKDKSAGKGKNGKGKAAKEADAEPALEPCKPAPTGKGRKGRVSARSENTRSAKAKSAHSKSRNGKHHQVDDSETCAPATKGDRPDGPAGVSRDSDNDDSRAVKGKDHDKTKGKNHDKNHDKTGDGDTDKGGRKAHYASRIWVQVLTAGDRDKMSGEWRSMVRKAHGLKGRKPYLTPWHSNFRLLTGPFDSDAEAQDFIAELRKDGVSGFEWTSPAGQAIDSLGN